MPFFNKFGGGSSRSFGFSKGFNLQPPTNLSAIVAETSVSISFTAPTGDTPTNFAYALSTNGGSTYGAFTDLSPADAISPIVISGLTSNQAYVVKLRSAINTNQSLDSATLSFQTLAAAPTGLSTSSITASSVVISFTQPAGGGASVSNYKYALSTNGGSTYGAYTALSPTDGVSPITITGLAAGTSYFIKIRAVTAAGDGTESGSVSITTLLPLPTTVEYIAVGGGGGGRGNDGGVVGGGAGGGGMASGSFAVSAGVTYTCTIGGGGSGAGLSTSGTNTTISGSGLSTITGGAGQTSTGYTAIAGVGGSGTFAGGNGGNGAGAGGAGSAGPSSSITGSSVTYGGGGGGSRGGAGGAGGGGYGGGGGQPTESGGPGTNNLGGGGGGGNEGWLGGTGGTGVVIIRHSNTLRQASTFTGTSVVNSGGFLIYRFNGSATIGWS